MPIGAITQAIQVTTFAQQLVANLGQTEPAMSINKHLEDYANEIRPQPLDGSFENVGEILLLRRSFAERWASRVMPQVLMELMRHETIETTI